MLSLMTNFLFNISFFFFIFILLDVLIFYLIKKNIKWINIIIFSVIYLLFIFILYIVFWQKIRIDDFIYYLNVTLKNYIAKTIENQIQYNEINYEPEHLKKILEIFLIKMIPSYIIMFSLTIAFLNYMVVRLYAMNRYKIINYIPEFTKWYLDEKMIWIFILGLFLLLLNNHIKSEVLYIISINIIFFMMNLYLIIGLSLLSFFIEKFKIPFYFQIFIFISVIFINFLFIIIILTGILDTWLNLRNIQRKGG